MASQQTHALIVVEGTNTLTSVDQGNKKLMLLFLALWMLLVGASIPEDTGDVLFARPVREQSAAASRATHEHVLLARGAARFDILLARGAARFDRDPAHYRKHHEAPPQCELGALEPEDSEEDGRLDALTVSFAAYFARFLPFVDQTLSLAATAFQAQFLAASALPRGPPSSSC